jgi:PTS system fructose-specific IIC component/PTS system nitrogen regulatory IIA component
VLLSEVFNIQHIKLDLESETKDEVFEELIETIIAMHPDLNRREMLEAVTMRENQMNTAVVPGVAVPHGYCHAVNSIVGVMGISHRGIEYDTGEREPVHCIFMLVMGDAYREKHVRILSKIFDLLNSQVLSKIQVAQSTQDVHNILCQFEQLT